MSPEKWLGGEAGAADAAPAAPRNAEHVKQRTWDAEGRDSIAGPMRGMGG